MSLIHEVKDIFSIRNGVISLHKSWETVEIKDIVKIQNGYAFKSANFNNEGRGFPLLRIRDILRGTTKTYFDGDYPEEYVVEKEDLLIGMDGDFNSDLWKGEKILLNQRVCRLFPNEKFLLKKFLAYGIGGYLEKINENTSSTTVKHLSSRSIGQIPFPLPPLPEQQRIVAKLDKLFASLESIESKKDLLLELRSKFIQSCLQNKGQFYTRKIIGEYIEEGKERIGDKWPECQKIGVSSAKGIIELRIGQKKSFEKYKIVRPGDFIYNTMRVNIGSIAIYKGNEIAITSPDYVVFRVKELLSQELLLGFLKSDQGLLEIGANTKGSVRARLYFSSLSEIRMPISNESIQNHAQKFLSGFNLSLGRINKLVGETVPQLKQAILAKAFRGELVEQILLDEPASVLLDKIKKLKNEAAKKPKKEVVRKKKKVEIKLDPEFPLYSVLLNHDKGLKEDKLYSVSGMTQHSFLIQLDKEIDANMIMQDKNGLILSNPNVSK